MAQPDEFARALRKGKEARRAIRKMLVLLRDADFDRVADSWREDFLKTLDDVAMRAEAARIRVAGLADQDIMGGP